MNKNCKLLPQLNQLFLQRQSYASHRKKIIQIRTKKPKATIRQQLSVLQSKRSSSNISLKDSKISQISKQRSFKQFNKMPPILERSRSTSNSLRWLSPFQKNKQHQEFKQNQRLRKRIITAKSDFGKERLNIQYDKFARIKARLLKYQVNPQTKKTVLKCEKRLNFLASNSRLSKTSHTQISQDTSDINKKTNIKIQLFQNRKSSNFSTFVKKTHQMRSQSTRNKLLNFDEKVRAKINYTNMQRNLEKYNRKLKTQASNVTIRLDNSRTSKLKKEDEKSSYFALTEIDI